MFSSYFESTLGRASLISPEDAWSLLFVLLVSVSAAIFLEQKYHWASKISGAIIALIIALVLSNLAILPTNSVLYDDIIWGYAVPLGIPLLLLQCNMTKIWRETGRMLVVFLIGAVGTVVGALLAFTLLKDVVPDAAGVDVPSQTIGATTVADNLLMAIYFFVLISIAGLAVFRRNFPHPYIEKVESQGLGDAQTQASAYWSRKDISLKDIAMNLAYSVSVVFFSKLIGAGLGHIIPTGSSALGMLNTFLSSEYVWITTISMLVATYAEDKVQKLNGAQEIGTYFIYLFLFVIGVPASVMQIITEAPALFLFTALMVLINMIFCFLGGKLLKFDLEDCILASNANIGGPTTAAGMAISQGWADLVGPTMLVGSLGYVVGTYAGVIIGSILGA